MTSSPTKRNQMPLNQAVKLESEKFKELYHWLEENMTRTFYEEVSQEKMMLIARSLMSFHLQNHFSNIVMENLAVAICLDAPDADLNILQNYSFYGIKNYQTYISKKYPPIKGIENNLRIAFVYFTEAFETEKNPLVKEKLDQLRQATKTRNQKVSDKDFDSLMKGINSRFLKSLPLDRLTIALDMFFRAKTRDNCQYEVRYKENWEEKERASMQIMLAWRNTPKHNFLYRLARTVYRHGLTMRRVNATYINPYEKQSILIMALSLHGSNNEAAWDAADITDFLRELVTIKYFDDFDIFYETFIANHLLRGNLGNFLRSATNFVHQVLVHKDPNLYTLENIRESLCRHPEITVQLCQAFEAKFHPENVDLKKYEKLKQQLTDLINKLDTGKEINDIRRKNVLRQTLNFIEHILKTNFYRNNKTALSFRLDPKYLDHAPFSREEKFPALPYAIFFIRGMHFFGFQIRFKDLARGGLRTVFPQESEHMVLERNNIFAECYNLAYTQHKKNKDIPEGGAKGIIFLKPYSRLESEAKILERELINSKTDASTIKKRIKVFKEEQKLEYLYQTQRAFVGSLLTLINCDSDGKLKAKHVIDYWKRPEYIYLGPDENMHNSMIQWIAALSRQYGYKPGSSFITSKPNLGINHKEFGVTSLGVNVYMHEVLLYLGIDPKKDSFTIKISGGPDGDVAGNQVLNLHKYYSKTARLLALTDVSGTIYDPKGLDLDEMVKLFHTTKPIRFYPPKKLSDGGFLLDRMTRRDEGSLVKHTLCWRKQEGKVVEDWLSGSEMNHLYRFNVHQTPTDVFVPAGGRPRTLNAQNISDYLDEQGRPTSRAIVEGANLYLTEEARQVLEDKGVLIIKDSSANKGGVICSSFEVLGGLVLGDEGFLENKDAFIKEILIRLSKCAKKEATLLLRTHRVTGASLIKTSDIISGRINQFTDQLLDYLEDISLEDEEYKHLLQCFLSYCPKVLRENFEQRLLLELPDAHKKAIIAAHIGAQLVYSRGLDWFPTVVDILPLIWQDPNIVTGE